MCVVCASMCFLLCLYSFLPTSPSFVQVTIVRIQLSCCVNFMAMPPVMASSIAGIGAEQIKLVAKHASHDGLQADPKARNMATSGAARAVVHADQGSNMAYLSGLAVADGLIQLRASCPMKVLPENGRHLDKQEALLERWIKPKKLCLAMSSGRSGINTLILEVAVLPSHQILPCSYPAHARGLRRRTTSMLVWVFGILWLPSHQVL